MASYRRTASNWSCSGSPKRSIARRLEAEGAKKTSRSFSGRSGKDGAVLAMVGGRDYEASQFNRATQAKRQAGSLFRLFVYLTALQRGYSPQTVVVDRPTQIGEWEPQNYSGGFRGSMTLRNAFVHSINTIAAQLGDEVGIPDVIDTAKRMGVQSALPAVPSLALGSAEVTLLEMTRAFGSVAAGFQLEPYSVRSIAGNSQQALYAKNGGGTEFTGQLAASRAMMLDLLQGVVNEGTGKAARLPNIPVGGKTGTTQEYRDAWFIGFTPDIVVGVWVGNDDNTPTNRVVGGDLPANIWHDFVGRALPIVSRRRHSLRGETPTSSIQWRSEAHPMPRLALRSQARTQATPKARQTWSIPRRCGSAEEKSSCRALSATMIVAWSGRSRGFSGDER